MLDQLRSLAVFAKVVELGSFRAAAQAFSLSPSVVSHHVSQLEERLSVPLLYRSTRRLALTPDGERLLTSAREMVDAASRAGVEVVKHQTHVVDDEMSGAAKKVVPGNASVSIYQIMERCALSANKASEPAITDPRTWAISRATLAPRATTTRAGPAWVTICVLGPWWWPACAPCALRSWIA